MFIIQSECPYCHTLIHTTNLLFKMCPNCNNVFKIDLDKSNLVYGSFKLFKRKRKILKKINHDEIQRINKKMLESLGRRLIADPHAERKCLQIAGYCKTEFGASPFRYSGGNNL